MAPTRNRLEAAMRRLIQTAEFKRVVTPALP
jgi:hypothetical protein